MQAHGHGRRPLDVRAAISAGEAAWRLPADGVAAACLERLDADAVYALWQRWHGRWAQELARLNRRHTGALADFTPADIHDRLVAPRFGPGSGRVVSLIIPAYKESHRIERSVRLVRRFLDEFPLAMEVIYVVESSPDDTLALARDAAQGHAQIRVHDNGVQRGKGHAVRCGVQQARGDIVFYNDTDLSVPLHQLLYFLAVLIERPRLDVLIGDRVRMTGRAISRRLMSRAFRHSVGAIANLPGGWDTQCGFKAMRRHAAERVFSAQSLHGFAFDVELLLHARTLGLRVGSQKVPWLNDERSTVRPLSDLRDMALELMSLRQSLHARTAAHAGLGLAAPARRGGNG